MFVPFIYVLQTCFVNILFSACFRFRFICTNISWTVLFLFFRMRRGCLENHIENHTGFYSLKLFFWDRINSLKEKKSDRRKSQLCFIWIWWGCRFDLQRNRNFIAVKRYLSINIMHFIRQNSWISKRMMVLMQYNAMFLSPSCVFPSKIDGLIRESSFCLGKTLLLMASALRLRGANTTQV